MRITRIYANAGECGRGTDRVLKSSVRIHIDTRPLPAKQDIETVGDRKLADKKAKTYETMFIVRPNLDEEAVDRTVVTVEEFIKAQGGTIESTDKKGRKRLAYEVDKMRDGYYVLIVFKCKTEAISLLKRMMTLSEDIIRSLIVVQEQPAVHA